MTSQVKYFDTALHYGIASPTPNVASSFPDLLKTILVDGFNPRTVSGLVRSGATVTATTSTAHQYVSGQVIKIAGATPTDYNGEFPVTVTGSTTFTYTIATTPGAASGSMSSLVAPLNWANPFNGTNVRVFKPTNVQASPAYWRFYHTGGNLAVAAQDQQSNYGTTYSMPAMEVKLFKAMSTVDIGTLDATGYCVGYGWAGTALRVIVVGDDFGFYLAFVSSSSPYLAYYTYYFGDCVPFWTGLPRKTMVCWDSGATSVSTVGGQGIVLAAGQAGPQSRATWYQRGIVSGLDGISGWEPLALATVPLGASGSVFGPTAVGPPMLNGVSMAFPVFMLATSRATTSIGTNVVGAMPGLLNPNAANVPPGYATQSNALRGICQAVAHVFGTGLRTLLLVEQGTYSTGGNPLALDITGPWR